MTIYDVFQENKKQISMEMFSRATDLQRSSLWRDFYLTIMNFFINLFSKERMWKSSSPTLLWLFLFYNFFPWKFEFGALASIIEALHTHEFWRTIVCLWLLEQLDWKAFKNHTKYSFGIISNAARYKEVLKAIIW